MKKKGKLIVIDGIDGSGKATQSRLLVSRLKKEKKKVRHIDFPQYDNNFFGELIGKYLRGQFGDFAEVDPRIASMLYAADRFESKQKIEKWLNEDCIVVVDRYVSSNQIHQGGKLRDSRKRKEFFKWLDTMEHDVFGLPRPDRVIYLDIPVSFSLRLLKESNKELVKKKKKYLRGRKDIVEGNKLYLENSRKSAQKLAHMSKKWVTISCLKKGKLLSPEAIHEEIFFALKEMFS
jgi:dTMP kinase